MDNLTAADIKGNVSDISAVRIEDQISRLEVTHVNRRAAVGLIRRRSGNIDSEVCHDRLGESGTVCAVRQAGTTVNIRIANKLYCIICNLLTQI